MSPFRDRRQIRAKVPPGETRAQARARRIERQLDELLWQVATEPDLPTDAAGPAEPRPERIARDVARWRQTRLAAPAARLDPHRVWPRAAAAALALCVAGAAGYWQGRGAWPAHGNDTPRAAVTSGDTAGVAPNAGTEPSAYMQIARAPDPGLEQGWQRNARACSSESWYCVQVVSRRREL